MRWLEDAIPPPSGVHHSLTFIQYGSDETGWDDKLGLHVIAGGKWHTFFLDDGDMDRTEATIDFVIAALAKEGWEDPHGNQASS